MSRPVKDKRGNGVVYKPVPMKVVKMQELKIFICINYTILYGLEQRLEQGFIYKI